MIREDEIKQIEACTESANANVRSSIESIINDNTTGDNTHSKTTLVIVSTCLAASKWDTLFLLLF